MFENQQRDDVEALIQNDVQFRRLYQKHKELDKKVNDAQIGALPMDDRTLRTMKVQKLQTKEQLQRMWDTKHGAH